MSSTSLKCDNCGAALGENDIDLRRGSATCPFCGGRTAFPAVPADDPPVTAPAEPPVAATPDVAVRRKVPRPDSVSCSESVDGIRLTYRWFTPALFFMLFFCIAWDGFLVFWYSTALGAGGPRGAFSLIFFLFPICHVAVGVGLTYAVIAGFLNRTLIDATRDELRVTHGPVPWKGNKTIPAERLDQLYSSLNVGSNGGHSYCVSALLKDGRKEKLISSLNADDEARFIERTIEEYMRLEHHPVVGELP